MTTLQEYIDDIKEQLQLVTKVPPFQRVTFGDVGTNIVYPSLHFMLDSMDKFDEVHLVNDTMQLRWELIYKVHILCAGLSLPTSWDYVEKTVSTAVEIFINQIPESERLNNKAWWIEPDSVIYGVIGVDSAIDQKGVQGGTFDLIIRFLQDV